MITSTTEKKSVVSLLLVGSLFMLTGCLGEKAKDTASQDTSAVHAGDINKSEVLLSIDGKPVLYADDFEDQKSMAQQSNQQLNMILQMMPDAEYSMLFKSIEAGHLMKAWVVKQGLDQDAKFIKQMNQYIEAVKLQMYMKLFEDAHPVTVTDHEAQDYYKAKRDQIPGLIVAPAGVDIVYVDFDTKAKAEAFAAKVKDGLAKHFKTVAKEFNVKVQNMVVNADSAINETLKNVVLGITKFPAKEVVKIDDNSYWVVGIQKKKDAEYRSFDMPEVKQGITKMCKDEKREIELSKHIEKLMTELHVEENKAYFENKKQNQAKAVSNAEQLVMQMQQQAAQGNENEQDDFQEDDAVLNDKI